MKRYNSNSCYSASSLKNDFTALLVIFERGDETVYTVGPLASFPQEIRLKNDAPDFEDILAGLGQAIVDVLLAPNNSIYDLIDGDADYVGTKSIVMEPDDLSTGSSATVKYLYINGKDEGKYRVYCQVHKVSKTDLTHTFEVKILRLYCLNYSLWDQASPSDEPFLIAILAGYPGEKQSYLSKAFRGVDTGDTRTINKVLQQVELPK